MVWSICGGISWFLQQELSGTSSFFLYELSFTVWHTCGHIARRRRRQHSKENLAAGQKHSSFIFTHTTGVLKWNMINKKRNPFWKRRWAVDNRRHDESLYHSCAECSVRGIRSIRCQLMFWRHRKQSCLSCRIFMPLSVMSKMSATCDIYMLGNEGVTHFDGVMPKGPYLPCASMAGRALLAGCHRFILCSVIGRFIPEYGFC